jgi:hypothetical protein
MGGKPMAMRARGGRMDDDGDDVAEPAPSDKYNAKDSPTMKEAEEKKHGGKVKRAHGGRTEMKGEHEHGRRRLDRPGRKRGGGVGADMHPLSTASRTKNAEGHDTDDAGETGLDEGD